MVSVDRDLILELFMFLLQIEVMQETKSAAGSRLVSKSTAPVPAPLCK